jgi:hypothetical protein
MTVTEESIDTSCFSPTCVNKLFREKLQLGAVKRGLRAVLCSCPISRDTMFELFRSGEILPDGRTNQDEAALVLAGRANIPKAQNQG